MPAFYQKRYMTADDIHERFAAPNKRHVSVLWDAICVKTQELLVNTCTCTCTTDYQWLNDGIIPLTVSAGWYTGICSYSILIFIHTNYLLLSLK